MSHLTKLTSCAGSGFRIDDCFCQLRLHPGSHRATVATVSLEFAWLLLWSLWSIKTPTEGKQRRLSKVYCFVPMQVLTCQILTIICSACNPEFCFATSWPLDFILCALRALRPIRWRARPLHIYCFFICLIAFFLVCFFCFVFSNCLLFVS